MTAEENDVIASRELIGVRADGKRLTIRIRVGKPYPTNEVDWACPVAVEGIHDRPADMQGVDSLQALLCAVFLARSVLTTFVESGGSLFWPDDETSVPASVEELFGPISSERRTFSQASA